MLDEADEMLDMGFREELEEILDATPATRRTLLFSATMPRPIVALAKRYQKDALRIETLGDKEGHQDIAYQAVAVSPTDIEHAVVNLLRFHEAGDRNSVLRHARGGPPPARQPDRARLPCRRFSGEHSQNERNQALQALRDQRARVCVATDVAARGIDLPSVSLVIHVELPRDAEALQHRSGRTGRAGRKGTAVLIVPFQRRKRVEAVLRGARIDAEWIPVPSASSIRAKDRERLLTSLSAPVELDDEDRDLAAQLTEQLTPAAIAAALIRSLRTDLPAPEDIFGGRPEGRTGGGRGPRAGFEGASWFRINAGRRHNADPRWLLPLICRYGHVTRTEIGAIRLAANESYFQVSERATPGFIKALRRATIAPEDQGLIIELAEPRETKTTYRPERAHEKPTPKNKKPRHSKRG